MCCMTEELFRADARLTECSATVLGVGDQGVVLDRTVFYPLGGGQAGDAGWLQLPGGAELAIADTRKEKAEDGQPTGRIVHLPAPGQEALLATLRPGAAVTARIDAPRRHPHWRRRRCRRSPRGAGLAPSRPAWRSCHCPGC